LLIRSNEKISSSKIVNGVVGETGIELFLADMPGAVVTYHFAIGAGFTSASADKIENSPRYGNGLIFSNGIRFYW
jgi:hypothetical protein